MIRNRFILLLVLAVMAAGPAAAIMWKDYTRAIAEAENRKDYQLAFNEALILALAGENTGYDVLSRYYATGTVVPADPSMAARILCLEAERGDRNAQIRLAVSYADGNKGFPANPSRQWLWAEIAGRDLTGALREQYGINRMQQTASERIKVSDEDALRELAKGWEAEKAHPSDRFGKYCP